MAASVSDMTSDAGNHKAGFAKLQGEDFEYYMQTYSIILGRNSKKEKVDLDIFILGGGINVSRRHARIFYDFKHQRFSLEVLSKNGCLVEGVLHLPGSAPVKLDSQDLLQIGEKKFYFLLPTRSIFSTPSAAAAAGQHTHIATPSAQTATDYVEHSTTTAAQRAHTAAAAGQHADAANSAAQGIHTATAGAQGAETATTAAQGAETATTAAQGAETATAAAQAAETATAASQNAHTATAAAQHAHTATPPAQHAHTATPPAQHADIATTAAQHADIATASAQHAHTANAAAQNAHITTTAFHYTDPSSSSFVWSGNPHSSGFGVHSHGSNYIQDHGESDIIFATETQGEFVEQNKVSSGGMVTYSRNCITVEPTVKLGGQHVNKLGIIRADKDADNKQILLNEEKDVVASVTTLISDLCGPGEWTTMEKLHSELIERCSMIWPHRQVQMYLTPDDGSLAATRGMPWFNLLKLLRKHPDHFVINMLCRGQATSVTVSLVSLVW